MCLICMKKSAIISGKTQYTIKGNFGVFQNYFLNKSKIVILISDTSHKTLPSILITFINKTKINVGNCKYCM